MKGIRSIVLALASAGAAGMAFAAAGQQTLDFPRGEFEPYGFDSGLHDNVDGQMAAVFQHEVQVDGAAWLRIYFGEIELAGSSFLRMTSMFDGEVQELDSAGLAMWQNSTAYLNGESVLIELVAGPFSTDNRFTIEQIALEAGPIHQEVGLCGLCGADNRVPSFEEWTGRLLPAGCTASVWNADSCLVSAGHCRGGNMVIQFRVPPSSGNCFIRHPPVEEQFPIVAVRSQNAGVGFDWMAMTSGVNNLGERPYDRYGVFRPIAPNPPRVGDSVAVWGYGVDTECVRTQTQQTDSGSVTGVGGTSLFYSVDVTGGNSGSSIIRNGEIIGIVTHCPCPNAGTRIDKADFAAARDDLCPVRTELDGFFVHTGTHTSGNLDSLKESDNDRLVIRSGFGETLTDLHKMEVSVFAHTVDVDGTGMELLVESNVSDVGASARVSLRNWDTGELDQVWTYSVPVGTDDIETIQGIVAEAYIDPDGNIEVFLQYRVFVPFLAFTFDSRLDHLNIVIE